MPSVDTVGTLPFYRKVTIYSNRFVLTQKKIFCCHYITYNVSNFDTFFHTLPKLPCCKSWNIIISV